MERKILSRWSPKRDKFEYELSKKPNLKVLVVAIKVHGTEIREVITTTEDAYGKAKFILQEYDRDLKKKDNNYIEIVDYMLIE